jgi:hypothetical protein
MLKDGVEKRPVIADVDALYQLASDCHPGYFIGARIQIDVEEVREFTELRWLLVRL